MRKYLVIYWIAIIVIASNSCKKMISIDLPSDRLTDEFVFSDSANATSAVLGMYSLLLGGATQFNFGNGVITAYTGLAGDELYLSGTNAMDLQFYNNGILDQNTVNSRIWRAAYIVIYQANACMEGIEKSSALRTTVKNQLIGECKLIRAFSYYYLVNLYGPVPLVLTTSFGPNAILPRTNVDTVLTQVEKDLLDAKMLLTESYPSAGKLRANKYTAVALLSKVYLYNKKWLEAESACTDVIQSGIYLLEPNLNSVFLASSREAIWHMKQNMQGFETTEGQLFIPSTSVTIRPAFPITPGLLSAFELGDRRRLNDNWVKSKVVSGQTFIYPFKYKLRMDNSINPLEHYIMFRLGEQYLIRAETRLENGNLSGAISDINLIRSRAGLANTLATTAHEIRTAIEQERRVELFCEWGSRFFDLKRWGKADAIFTTLKAPNWQTTDQVFPIPKIELDRNPFLIQNPGY